MKEGDWIAVDLDGTLAIYNGWSGADQLGEPIPLMVNRVLKWLSDGKDVRIFTARTCVPEQIPYIEAWCLKHLGKVLPITATKDPGMVELWDDRCIQVIKNTGEVVGMEEPKVCHDCGAEEGQNHSFGCDMAYCPFCGGQLISCGCCYELLDIDVSEGTWVYNHGMSDEQQAKWEELLKHKGLIPYIRIPVLCELCGEVFPDLFSVPDESWEKYIVPPLQRKVLCSSCYGKQVGLFPNGWRNAPKR